jgi:hypothetical protein
MPPVIDYGREKPNPPKPPMPAWQWVLVRLMVLGAVILFADWLAMRGITNRPTARTPATTPKWVGGTTTRFLLRPSRIYSNADAWPII